MGSPLDQAIAAGLDYILSLQSLDGSWTDWDLPPGSSSAWTTGYIGYKLSNLPQHLKTKASPHLKAGAEWLLRRQFAGGGWGYNTTVGTDADTTSCAVLALAYSGLPAPKSAYTLLTHHQQPDGGFATYLPGDGSGSWTVSHPDVTPLALLALLTRPAPDRHCLDLGSENVKRQQNPDGTWNSFWWDSFLYGTEASLSFLHAQNVAVPLIPGIAIVQPANAFEGALLISSLLYSQPAGFRAAVRELADQLVAEQQPDGSWKSAAILRITRRDCFEPWASRSPGPLFADPQRLFTTSTVINALSRTLR